MNYEVVVGNVGTVYRGTDGAEAEGFYKDHVKISQANLGRAGHEAVVLFCDGVIIREYNPGNRS